MKNNRQINWIAKKNKIIMMNRMKKNRKRGLENALKSRKN